MVTTLSIRMPQGKRCAVCFTYDFDAMSGRIGGLGETSPTPMSQGEFGAVGLQRILDLLDSYSIKASFFIPGYNIETFPELTREIFKKGHEIGHHGYLHETPLNLKRDEEQRIIRHGSDCIKKITGKDPSGYRSPSWNLSPNSVELIIEGGFIYDSSMMAHDYLPYLVRVGDEIRKEGGYKFGEDTKLIELPVSWSLDDWPHFETTNPSWSGLRSGSAVLENWINDFEYMYTHVPGGVYIITFHPQVSGRGHRMMAMEKLIQHIRSKEGVWFARMDEVAKAVKQPT